VSCGDNSGTHVLEQFLWDAAKVNPNGSGIAAAIVYDDGL